ncbi:signal peptidase II [Orbaceae bacterium ac157xtp]
MVRTNGLIWLMVTLATFIIDSASKFYIHYTFYYQESLNVLPFFSITYVRNRGAAFSMLEGQRWLLAIIALIISVVIVWMLYKNDVRKKIENLSLSLILGGALGNLFDRLYHGYVIDFLDVNFGHWHYPTFNLADTAICVGIVLFIFISYKSKKSE